MNDEQLTQRMRAASDAIEMSDAAQARHLEAISAALTTAEVAPLSSARANRRRRVVASVVAAAVIAPAGLAAASDGSLPGERLYPVKQLSERVLVLFDGAVVARHRIEEIEALEGAGDVDLYEDARHALAELGEDHPLWQRLAAATAQNDTGDDQTISDDDDRSEDDSAGTAVVELALPDGTKATFTIAGGGLEAVDAPSGWTVSGLDDDEATLESNDYTVEVEVLSDGTLSFDVTERGDEPASDDDESATTSTVDPTDDDESADSETATTSITDTDEERADDSDDPESDPSDDEREDDDVSASP